MPRLQEQGPSALPETSETSEMSLQQSCRIVVVRDSADDRADVQRLLTTGPAQQFAFTEAATGTEAIHAIRSATEPPDCLVLDVRLPDMDALELLAALADSTGIPICAVVVLIGNASSELGRAAVRAGAQDYVGDEWLSPLVLARAVENAIERWAMARGLQERNAALRLSEQHYRALATSSADIAYRMSADWSTMLPLDGRRLVPSTYAPLGSWLWIHQNIPPDEHARVRAAIDEAIAHTALFELEHRVLRPDGSIGWTFSRAVPIFDENGDVVEWFGAASDITARKATADGLTRSEAFARSVIESSADCVKGLSLDGRVLWMNVNGQRQMEVSDFTEIKGCDWGSYWDAGGLRPEAEAALAAARAGRVGRFSGNCPTHAGSPRWWDVTVTAIHGVDGRIEQFLSVSRDVTEKRASEEASKLSTQRMQLALKCSAVALFQQDLELRYTWIYNPALGFRDSDVCGKRDGDLMERAADAEVTEALKREVIRTGVGGRHEVLVHHQNAARYFQLLVEPLWEASGVVGGVTCAAIDITDFKRTEQLLSDQDARKDEFLATLSHELRNPLAPIRSGVAVLRMTRNPEQAEKTLGMIDRQLGHLVHIVDDLLDISRVRSGKITLRSERVVLRDVVDAAVEACRVLIDVQNHALSVELPDEPLVVAGDQTRLVQIVANLLTNSAKYSEPGGHIKLTVVRDRGEAVIRVADTGTGIAAETLPTLWDMFTQVRDTLDKAQAGLGIGLSLVKRLVELHGGTVAAESPGLGCGSTFTVRLPFEAASAAAGPAVPATNTVNVAPPPTRRRILVVDDNRDTADSLAILLEQCGNETLTAYDGGEAVQAAASFRPSVVLLDIGLPTMDGYEAARKIREQPWGRGMVLVALTGWGSDEHRRESKAAGFDAHLVKPADLAVLTKLLNDLMSAASRASKGGLVANA